MASSASSFFRGALFAVAAIAEASAAARQPVVTIQPEDPARADMKALRRELEDSREALQRIVVSRSASYSTQRLQRNAGEAFDKAEKKLDEVDEDFFSSDTFRQWSRGDAVKAMREGQRLTRELQSSSF